MMAGSLIAVLAAVAALSLNPGALRAQQSSDEGRMRSSSEEAGWPKWSLIPGERIAHTGDDGTFIVLSDSTVWEVYLSDRTSTAGWREGDFLIVKKAPLGQNIGQTGYEYELINGRTNERAIVGFRGKSG
jgi:hypothetical protein